MAITKAEDDLIHELVQMSDQKDLLIGISIKARNEKKTEGLIKYIKDNDIRDIEKIVDFLWPRG